MKNIVEVSQLEKSFGNFKAVQNVNFSIKENKIYGLLGRNGAGKTTLMKMITAQIFPTSGVLKVFNEDPYENRKVLNQICFIKESQKYPDNFLVRDVIEVSKSLFPNWDPDFAHSLIKDFNLPLKRRIKKLSRGMLSAVGIVVGLASRAPLTVFDEPYLGLDAVSRGVFYDRLMEDYVEHPRTVILSTHLIDEVSNLLEHIFVIADGELMIDEDAEKLRGMAYTVTGQSAKVEAFLAGKEIVHKEPFGGLLSATVIRSDYGPEQKQAEAVGLEVTPVSLQQLIVYLTTGKRDSKGAVAK
ncbi:ABC transporter ATP-binding protein [Siminovitchia acidinfaciens]|uniref:ABC transporter ATP-binding protein n=1 Tax=Siminovitchia acidinfaciens TaxID=2321395 RepID=A0A429Y6R7_9BACI|nr:ABC transporter ATP-binding protein [Siminovitchia acidinfaciens]RST77116.1 ABC transporter ATP-binding protein [Siminovitchia acidinfaciens]